jgi:hypothetical protein
MNNTYKNIGLIIAEALNLVEKNYSVDPDDKYKEQQNVHGRSRKSRFETRGGKEYAMDYDEDPNAPKGTIKIRRRTITAHRPTGSKEPFTPVKPKSERKKST